MKARTRAVLEIAVIVAILAAWLAAMLALPALTAAAEPEASHDTLGASVQSHIYVHDDRTITFKNLSTVPAVFTFTGAGGWMTDSPTVTLPAGATGHVGVTGDGEDNSAIGVNVTSAGDVAPGTTRTALAFQARVAHERPFDPSGIVYGALAGALGFIALVVVLRKTRPWELRLGRSPGTPGPGPGNIGAA